MDIRENIRENNQDRVAELMVMHICLMQCKNMIVSTNSFFYNMNNLLNMAMIGLLLILYIRFFWKSEAYRYINGRVFVVLVAILSFWLVSCLLDNQLFVNTEFPYSYVRRQALTCISYSIPLYVISSYLDDAGVLLKKLYSAAPIIFGISVVSFASYLYSSSDVVTRGYSMSFGNQMLLGAAILLFKYLDDEKNKDLIMFIVTVLLIVAAGSRGPLVSILCLMIYAVFRVRRNRKNIILLFGLFYGMLLCLIFTEPILRLLGSIFDALGITSRTLVMILNGKISYASGRGDYHEALLNAINSHPLTGLGAFGGEKTVGLAHSLYIDIFANFGYLLGALFIIVLVARIISYISRNKKSPRATVIIMFSMLIFPRGFFDETFWAAWYMWIIMGLLVSAQYEKTGESIQEKT